MKRDSLVSHKINQYPISSSAKEIVLNEGESIDIPPLKHHVHSNPFDKISITFWKANGDITEIIDNIRKKSKM